MRERDAPTGAPATRAAAPIIVLRGRRRTAGARRIHAAAPSSQAGERLYATAERIHSTGGRAPRTGLPGLPIDLPSKSTS